MADVVWTEGWVHSWAEVMRVQKRCKKFATFGLYLDVEEKHDRAYYVKVMGPDMRLSAKKVRRQAMYQAIEAIAAIASINDVPMVDMIPMFEAALKLMRAKCKHA